LLYDISDVVFDIGTGGCLGVPESASSIDVRVDSELSTPSATSSEPSPVNHEAVVEVVEESNSIDGGSETVLPPEPPADWDPESATFQEVSIAQGSAESS
jgi:hypothetical protein